MPDKIVVTVEATIDGKVINGQTREGQRAMITMVKDKNSTESTVLYPAFWEEDELTDAYYNVARNIIMGLQKKGLSHEEIEKKLSSSLKDALQQA